MRCVDVWTSLGAKVCVFRFSKCVAGIAKRRKDGQNLVNVNVGFSHVTYELHGTRLGLTRRRRVFLRKLAKMSLIVSSDLNTIRKFAV